MNYQELSNLIYPELTHTPEEYEAMYPARELPEGAKVTRLGPSPTGFIHLGNLYGAFVDERLAHQSNGVFYLRIEDTDDKRFVENAVETIITSLDFFGIEFDEGVTQTGDIGTYGDYTQSHRGEIYRTFAKELLSKGLAYPCFLSEEEITAVREQQDAAKLTPGIYAGWSKYRDWDRDPAVEAEIIARLEAGEPYVIRLKSKGAANVSAEDAVRNTVVDAVRGELSVPENFQDIVIIKQTGIPTYHFAHVIDDHLMRTTHVVRGEEWLPSVAKHIQLFRYLGFKLPKYLHTAQIMQLDANGNKKKLSKRDLGANMSDYTRLGYAPECVSEYLLTILNSNFEEWRMQNPDKHWSEFKFDIKKMSASGCLFDATKLGDVSKNVVSKMTAGSVYDQLLEWANDYARDFAAVLAADPDYAKKILAIGRGGKKPRKAYGLWSEVKDFYSFFWDAYFTREDTIPESFPAADVKAALLRFADTLDLNDDANAWFEKVKAIAADLGYAADMRAYKADPAAFKGSVADISAFLRLAVTGRQNAPDLYTVMHLLGRERTFARLDSFLG